MRNEPKPLNRTDAMRAYRFKESLEMVGETPVTLHYTKRDGSDSSSRGVVAYFNGKDGMDTMSVTIDTADKGPRTINLCRVKAVTL